VRKASGFPVRYQKQDSARLSLAQEWGTLNGKPEAYRTGSGRAAKEGRAQRMIPQPQTESLRQAAAKYAPHLICGTLLLVMAINFLTVIARKSITIDETLAIPSGYYYLKTGSFNIDSDHPPFPKSLSALPLLFLPLETPKLDDIRDQHSDAQTLIAAERFWSLNRSHFQAIFFWARVPMILLTLLIGVIIFVFTKRLFNARAAVLAVALFSLEPTILAHGRVVKDIHVAFGYALFFLALYIYGSAPTWKRAVSLGVACGVALVVKYSMLILIPVLLLAGVVILLRTNRGRRQQIVGQVAISFVVALLVVNAAYFFRHQPMSAQDLTELEQSNPAYSDTMLRLLPKLSAVAPPYFLSGAFVTFNHNDLGHPGFLLGEYSDHGWRYYFPVAFALKTTIPFLLLTGLSLGWAVWRGLRGDTRYLVVLIPIVIYGGSAMFADINIGIRHLLPLFPFLFMLAGVLLDHWLSTSRNRIALAAVFLIFLFCIEESVRAYPNYIPYMNQLASTRPHWMLLSDSNIEWGDDNGALAEYLKAKGETSVRAACLGGSIVLPLHGVKYVDLLSPEVKLEDTRYVAIGASFLNGSTVPGWSAGSGRETPEQRHNYFASYRDRVPEAVFGGTIYLFRER
jgi:4-amino-4-deoxy-L-arabinose transferase-like glycosyltransferase